VFAQEHSVVWTIAHASHLRGDLLDLITGPHHRRCLVAQGITRSSASAGGKGTCRSGCIVWLTLVTLAVVGAAGQEPAHAALASHLDSGNAWVADARRDASAPAGNASQADGTLVREPNGLIAVIAGGAPFTFANWEEYLATGYQPNQWIDVPAGYISSLPAAPSDGTLLRDYATGSIVVIAGGAGIRFIAWEEVLATGYQSFVNVPARYLRALPDAPRDGTLLRDNGTGAIVVLAGGAGIGFISWEEVLATGYRSFVNVPARYLRDLASMPRDGTLLAAPGDPTVWKIVAGTRSVTTAAAGDIVTLVPSRALAAIRLAPTPPPPGDVVTGPAERRVYVVVRFKVRNQWTVHERGTRVRQLAVRSVPRGTRIGVRCRGPGCPFTRRAYRARTRHVNLRRPFEPRLLGAGARVTIGIDMPRLGRYAVRFRVRAATVPVRTDYCPRRPPAERLRRCT
jgi:hypothetical protein